jgi:transcription antitermination factor NusA-like protein
MMMPLCSFCIKSGILCQKCQKKVESGQIGETDIRIAKLLMKLEEKYAFRENNGSILREIAQNTGKRVRIMEKHGDERKFLEDLFAPAVITTINKIWLPDGTTETRVIMASRPRRLPMKSRVLKKMAKQIRGITLRIAYEDRLERMSRR